MSYRWEDAQSQKGKIAIVTGANVGLGYETARALAKKEATVIMACRNKSKAEAAKNEILKESPNADIRIEILDLSVLESVKTAASSINSNYDKIDYLINNAGIMIPPYSKTVDGFESQMGTNYFGHFLLTRLLLDKIEATPNSRIVTLSSLAHDWGPINFEDMHFEKKYDKQKAYAQSKLACLIFSYELENRLRARNSATISLAAHPGIATTNLSRSLPGPVQWIFSKVVGPLIFQNPEHGAWPTLRATLDSNAKGGDYYGPKGFKEWKGKPVLVGSNDASKDPEITNRLWKISEELTGAKY